MLKVLDAVLLTAAFVAADDSKLNSRNGGVIYVDYTKGAESGMTIGLEFSPDGDVEGSEMWCAESNVDNSGNVTARQYVFSATGKYRIPVAAGAGDDKCRISVKANSGVDGFGTVSLFAKF